ncbi:hypothetical protein PG985_009757 [Apiospora marii]|uniref:uncharacterized protein n=1 Tax=Apiospora marii TaxID=335849 RepID=UPI00313213EB
MAAFVPRLENIEILAMALREHYDASTANPSPAFSAEVRGPIYGLDLDEQLGPHPACFSPHEFFVFVRTIGTEFGRANMPPTQICQGVLRSELRVVPNSNADGGARLNNAAGPQLQLQGIPVLFAMVAFERGDAAEYAEFDRIVGVVHERCCASARDALGDVTRRGVGWALCVMGIGRDSTTRSLPQVVAFAAVRRQRPR